MDLEVWRHESVVHNNNDPTLLMRHLRDRSNVHNLHCRIGWRLDPYNLRYTDTMHSNIMYIFLHVTQVSKWVESYVSLDTHKVSLEASLWSHSTATDDQTLTRQENIRSKKLSPKQTVTNKSKQLLQKTIHSQTLSLTKFSTTLLSFNHLAIPPTYQAFTT